MVSIIIVLLITKECSHFGSITSRIVRKVALLVKKANIISVCRECQALSPDMPIIILQAIIRNEQKWIFRKLSKLFKANNLQNNVSICRKHQFVFIWYVSYVFTVNNNLVLLVVEKYRTFSLKVLKAKNLLLPFM